MRFLRGAERARLQREVPDAQPLLCGHNIYIHDAARKPQDSNVGALKRVAAALGAQASQLAPTVAERNVWELSCAAPRFLVDAAAKDTAREELGAKDTAREDLGREEV